MIAELKWRILFSHFHHPLKRYGQRVGRALTLLIKAVVQVFDTWAMLNTGDVREFAGRVESSLSKLYPGGIPPKKRPRLFELDVKEMFPRLPRDGVISAITSLASELTHFLKTPPPLRALTFPHSCVLANQALYSASPNATENWTNWVKVMLLNFIF